MGSATDRLATILAGWTDRHGIRWALRDVPTTESVEEIASCSRFSASELDSLNKFRHAGRRASWVAGRLAAREAVASWYRGEGRDPGHHEIPASRSGAPRIEGRDDLHLSISHSGSVAVAVVGNRRLGIDLEALEERPDSLVRSFFSESERLWIEAVPSERTRRGNTAWTRKEAVAKLLGKGGSLRFADLAILDGESPWTIESASTPQHAISLALEHGN
ncbi:MAG TPA: 4'-phosphopantetheinyl transferase superfamily protein [Fibrobacteria bacterium]|nr:4'-phosphopantetheinyl transferase superfamily protein [Fibrobacteria bacterium]